MPIRRIYYSTPQRWRMIPRDKASADSLDRLAPNGIRGVLGQEITLESVAQAYRHALLAGDSGVRGPRHRALEASDLDPCPAGAPVRVRSARTSRRLPALGQRQLQPKRQARAATARLSYLALASAEAQALRDFTQALEDPHRQIAAEL